jgi:hypothetical protein
MHAAIFMARSRLNTLQASGSTTRKASRMKLCFFPGTNPTGRPPLLAQAQALDEAMRAGGLAAR